MDKNEEIIEFGQMDLKGKNGKKIHVLNVIGEIEGHENLNANTKTTKYEHVIPKLIEVENDENINGMLVIINTVGGDVECGLAIAEMISGMSKPTVSLVIGGSHSIGLPIAVSADYSYAVSTSTMVIHPVRLNGMLIGAKQTYDYFKSIQNRIIEFVTNHCEIDSKRLESLMMETEVFAKDVGSILSGEQMVKEGIINEIGTIRKAMDKLEEIADINKSNNNVKNR